MRRRWMDVRTGINRRYDKMTSTSLRNAPEQNGTLFGAPSFAVDFEASFSLRHPGRDAIDAATRLAGDVVRVYAVGGHEVADRSSLAIRSTIRIDDPSSPLVRFDTPCGAASGFDASDSTLHVMPLVVGAHARPLIRARMRAALHALGAWAVRFDLGTTHLIVQDDDETVVEQGSLACLQDGLVHITDPSTPTLLAWSDVAAILLPEVPGSRITVLRLDGTILHVGSHREA